ncbi:MAG: putative metal-binding protein [Firmicutes bacterium]|nr:putative metal-binding protein [Bacillota bacterium]
MEDTKMNSLSCSDCGLLHCFHRDKQFPEFCLTTNTRKELIDECVKLYKEDELVGKLAKTAAEIEGIYYGKLTRAEEIIAFAKRIGAKKIGIATCAGLINETKIFSKIVRAKGLECYSVICKVGSVDKTEIGIPNELKLQKDCFEGLCNPVLQAKLLNEAKTDLNVINGLCVGHDSLFIKYSEAIVTTLITKDRVTGHNPAAALYTCNFYYKRLLQEDKD